MTDKAEVLALIPARGGSKSVPRKNLRLLRGMPLVSHSITQAKEARRVTRVIVSTDDPEIAEVGRAAGAEVPFMRPSSIAQDLSTDYEFVRHALAWLRDNEEYEPDFVVQLRPTIPVRDVCIIDEAILAISSNPKADSLRAVAEACFTPYKMWHLGEGGYLSPLLSLPHIREPWNEPRQVLPAVYQQDGYIDIVRPRTIFEQHSITGKCIMPFFLERPSIDIDFEWELAQAESLLTQQK